MRDSKDDKVDAALSVLAAPLTLPPAACIVVGLAALRLGRRGKRHIKAEDAAWRLFTTGPWGELFDRLTWLPWAAMRSPPACLYVDVSTGRSQVVAHEALAPPPAGSKRLVVISDTHSKHRLLRLPAGDVLLHCGDVLSRGGYVLRNQGKAHARGLAALRDFNAWLGQLPHYKAKVVIAGNHDASLEALAPDEQRSLLSHAVYLQDSAAVVEGLSFYGTPWSSGKSANRAFQAAAPAIPADLEGTVDVLMSHCHHDALAVALQPTLHASGHAHNHHGVVRGPDAAFRGVAINASTCDGVYRARNLPVVVDVTRRRATG